MIRVPTCGCLKRLTLDIDNDDQDVKAVVDEPTTMIYRAALRASSRVARTRGHLSRLLSTRASTVLNALDLTPSSNGTVSGVYDGQWSGSGDVLESVCPSTGEVLAYVQGVSECGSGDVRGGMLTRLSIVHSHVTGISQ